MSGVVGIVLAGGLSTRMGGRDKCLLDLNGQTLLQRAVDKLKLQVDAVAINANSDAQAYRQIGLEVLPDSFEGYAGPLAGVLTGMEWAHKHGSTHVVTVAADTPFFPDNLVAKMQAALSAQKGEVAIAETPGGGGKYFNHPTFGLWPVALRDDLREALGQGVRKVVQWVKPHGMVNVAFSVDPIDPFFNVNKPEDYEQAQQFLKEYSL
jgi:molybdenum cofactor guanylyltransferase